MSKYINVDKLKLPRIGFDEYGDALLSLRALARILEEAVEDDVEKMVRCKDCANQKNGLCQISYKKGPMFYCGDGIRI